MGSNVSDYSVDLKTNTIEFVTAPTDGAVIELISIGIGGVELLDYQEFTADGETNLFLTKANYTDTSTVFVTVNGEYKDIGFIDSTDITGVTNKAMIQFGIKPEFGSIIRIVCLGASADVDSSGLPIVRVNKQTVVYDGSTRNLDLDGFVNLSRASALSSIVVEVNNRVLKGVDTTYYVYNGITNQFTLGIDPEESAGAILTSNIKVFVNDELKSFIQDYVYDGTTKELTIETSILTEGDTIKIENNFRTEYHLVGNNIVIDTMVPLQENDVITITWFGEYPSMQLISDQYVGGKVKYQLAHAPLSVNYIWVYKNGVRLTRDVDYRVALPLGVVYLTEDTTSADSIRIILFGNTIYRMPSAFEIHKDMLNVYHFKRFAQVKLHCRRF